MVPSALRRDHEDEWGPPDSHRADESKATNCPLDTFVAVLASCAQQSDSVRTRQQLHESVARVDHAGLDSWGDRQILPGILLVRIPQPEASDEHSCELSDRGR